MIVFAYSAYTVYSVFMRSIQYTIRNIPPDVDRVIRKRASQSGKTFNQTVVDLLTVQILGTSQPQSSQNFDWLFGQNTLDDSLDTAVCEQSQTNKSIWPLRDL